MLGNQITQIKLPSGKVVSLVDWSDKPLWSSVDIVDGATDQELDAFTYLISDPVTTTTAAAAAARTATERDTNVATAGAMASTEEMLVYAIKPEVQQFTITANTPTSRAISSPGQPQVYPQVLAMLHQTFLLRLMVSLKDYANAPFGYFNTGFGPNTMSGGDTLANGVQPVATSGVPAQTSVRSFVIPHHIGGQEKYRVTLANPGGLAVDFRTFPGATITATQMVTVRIILDGLYKRPVA